MSADLFAAFEDLSQRPPPPPPQQQRQPTTSSAAQPFSFQSPPHGSYVNPPATNQWHIASTIQPTHDPDNADDDGWGDFEVASGPPAKPAVTVSQQPQPPPNRIVRAPTLDLISNNVVGLGDSSSRPDPTPEWQPQGLQRPEPPSTLKHHRIPSKTVHADPNVLFDADDFDGALEGEGSDEDDDDFGDFEAVESNTQQPVSTASLAPPSSTSRSVQKAADLLLDLDLNQPTSSHLQSSHQSSSSAADVFAGMDFFTTTPLNTEAGLKKHNSSQASFNVPSANNKPKPSSRSFEEDWGVFDEVVEEPVNSSIAKPSVTNKPSASKKAALLEPPAEPDDSSWGWEPIDIPVEPKPKPKTKAKMNQASQETPQTAPNKSDSWNWEPENTKTETTVESIQDTALPPINIPPPSILLSAFPQLFDQGNDSLYKPVAGQPASVKNRILSDPQVHEFLEGYLSIATVAARVIAGRKVRWHRDKFLSQSMSISAAGSKGMKLAGVDKSQTVREDREAADVLSNWKNHVGRLKSTVAVANSSRGKQLKIPEITDTIQIQTVKDVPTAAKACVICGLKRNERIPKVDFEVEDSFGEWWVDHWGHLACKRFWLHHENTLRQR